MDSSDSINLLMKQRINRPSYTRVMSREFQTPSEVPVVSQRRQIKKQLCSSKRKESQDSDSSYSEESSQSSDMPSLDSYSDQSDSEVYFSADDEFLYRSTDTDHNSFESQKVDDITESKLNSLVSHNIDKPHDRHSLSKKQKRKRSRRYAKVFSDFLLDFEDIDIVETGKCLYDDNQPCVERPVPSLMELCLKSLHKSNLPHQMSLPSVLKKSLFASKYDLKLKRIQLLWLQRALIVMETKGKSHFSQNPDGPVKILFPARNIWNFRPFPFLETNMEGLIERYRHSKSSSFLLFTYVCVHHNEWSSVIELYKYLGVMASVVDLMMPSVTPSRSMIQKSGKTDSEQLLKGAQSNVLRVKAALMTRFPTAVSLYFDQVLPYVFWARGELQTATNLFLSMAESEKRSRYKTLFMTEVGRMHAQVGEDELASRFYRMAEDLALEKPKNIQNHSEIHGQMLMIQANVYDQGMMTQIRGNKAASMWKYMLTSHGVVKEGAAAMAGVSLLCFHSGSYLSDNDNPNFDCVRSMLMSLAQDEPELLYHLSLVHALHGNSSDAVKTFKNFKEGSGADGNNYDTNIQLLKEKYFKIQELWEPLILMVKSDGVPKPLHVMWRVQLQPFRIQASRMIIADSSPGNYNQQHSPCRSGIEADICTKTLNLHLTSDGYITGDMHMVLPPMRGVYLNPYTGILDFDQTRKNEPWKSRNIVIPDYRSWNTDLTIAPTMDEVYSDEKGVKVHIMMPNPDLLESEGKTRQTVTLHYTGPNGEHAKYSLYEKIRKEVYKDVRKFLKTIVFHLDPLYQKDALDYIDKCYRKHREMSSSSATSEAESLYRKRCDETADKKSKPEKRKNQTKQDNHKPFRIELQTTGKPLRYGNTLVLCLHIPSGSLAYSDSHIATVIINCSSKDSFLNPKIYVGLFNDTFTHYSDENKYHNNIGTEILCILNSRSKINVYDENGDVTYETEQWFDTFHCNIFTVGKSLLVTSGNMPDCIYTYHEGSEQRHEGFLIHSIAVTGCAVALLSLDTGCVTFVTMPTLQKQNIKFSDKCPRKPSLHVSEDRKQIYGGFSRMKILYEEKLKEEEKLFVKAIMALDKLVITLIVPIKCTGDVDIMVTNVFPMPGTPTDACFVGKNVGVLVSWTQHAEDSNHYREHLSFFDKDGQLMGVLPFLGPGPRSFFPVYLPGDKDITVKHEGYGEAGWYLYMKDGHEGIMCVKLVSQHY